MPEGAECLDVLGLNRATSHQFAHAVKRPLSQCRGQLDKPPASQKGTTNENC